MKGGGWSGDGGFNDYGYGGGGGYDGYGFGKGKDGGKGGGGSGKSGVPCKFYAQGNCTRGETCYFSHDVGPNTGGPQSSGWSGGKGGAFRDDDDPELDEIQDALAKQQLDDDKLRAEMASEMERMEAPPDNDSDDGSDALPPPATEKEIEEAQEIVRRAQDDLIERNKMKAKVKDANKSDLQAMINARLAKRWGAELRTKPSNRSSPEGGSGLQMTVVSHCFW